MSKHHLNIAHNTIVAGFMLFICLVALFTLDVRHTGMATSGSTVSIVNSSPIVCEFDVGAGYNIVSFYCLTTTTSVVSIVSGTSLYAMYQYNPGSIDQWSVYNPNLPSYVVQDLTTLSRRTGYIAIMNASANVPISGLLVASTGISVANGWNLVGYPSNKIRNVSDAFSSINTSFSQVVTYNKTENIFLTYNNPGGTLLFTFPDQGYWVNVTNATTWTVTG